MKVSIITVTYNSANTIVDTIDSVLGQSYQDLEHLIIDGGSSDATLQKIEPYREKIGCVISEPDRGMYDAMNKGIKRATGDVVAILNSDDFYSNSEVVSNVAARFDDSSVDAVYGDLHYVSHEDISQVVRNWRSGEMDEQSFRKGWHPPHPSFFVRRSVYEEIGGFDLNLRIAADYEFMLRALQKNKCRVEYIPEVLVKMRTGGESNRSIRNVIEANYQSYRAWRMNGYDFVTAVTAISMKPTRKLFQFFR